MKSVCLILFILIAVPDRTVSAASLTLIPILAQEEGAAGNAADGTAQPDQDVTVERGVPSSSSSPSSKITPVTQNFNVQGVIMLFLMAAALFPLCKSSARGR